MSIPVHRNLVVFISIMNKKIYNIKYKLSHNFLIINLLLNLVFKVTESKACEEKKTGES